MDEVFYLFYQKNIVITYTFGSLNDIFDIRYLLEMFTGVFTGSTYNDRYIISEGL